MRDHSIQAPAASKNIRTFLDLSPNTANQGRKPVITQVPSPKPFSIDNETPISEPVPKANLDSVEKSLLNDSFSVNQESFDNKLLTKSFDNRRSDSLDVNALTVLYHQLKSQNQDSSFLSQNESPRKRPRRQSTKKEKVQFKDIEDEVNPLPSEGIFIVQNLLS